MPGIESVVILTALALEREAVLEQIEVVGEEQHPGGTIYDTGTVAAGEGTIAVAVAEIGPENSTAAAHVERAVSHFSPDLLLFVGIAGGIKDVSHGDVVVASKVYGYQSGKDSHAFLSRPDVYRISHRLDQRARRLATGDRWQARLAKEASGGRGFFGPIVAGDVLLRSRDSPLFKFIEEHFNDALAAEMEGRGFFTGAHLNDHIPATVVRGISDLVADKTEENDAVWQPIAARRAAALAIELLVAVAADVSPLADGNQDAVTEITAHMSNAYYLNLPRLLSDSSLNLLSERVREELRGTGGWADVPWNVAPRLRGLCEKALEAWPGPALPLSEALAEKAIGARVAFDGQFRTRNWKKFDPEVGHTGDMEHDPHVYVDVDSVRVLMPIDPRWATTSTARTVFSRGSVPLSGLGLLRDVQDGSALVSPYVLAPGVQGRGVEAVMFP